MKERNIADAENFRVMECKNIYHKRNTSTGCVEAIKKCLADARTAAVNKCDETIDEENFNLGVDETFNMEIRQILEKDNYL